MPESAEHEFERDQQLNRREIAVKLRQLDIDVDFEDWDGLDDVDFLGAITMLGTIYDFDPDELLNAVDIEATTYDGPGSRPYIVSRLQSHGIQIDSEVFRDVVDADLQSRFIELVNESGQNPDEIGRECFGEAWKEGGSNEV